MGGSRPTLPWIGQRIMPLMKALFIQEMFPDKKELFDTSHLMLP